MATPADWQSGEDRSSSCRPSRTRTPGSAFPAGSWRRSRQLCGSPRSRPEECCEPRTTRPSGAVRGVVSSHRCKNAARMKPTRQLVSGIAVGVCVLGVAVLSADWTSWRGPNASGVAPDRTLPIRWSATDNIAWKAPIAGAGVSTPIVSGDRVYVTSQIGAGRQARGQPPAAGAGSRRGRPGRARAGHRRGGGRGPDAHGLPRRGLRPRPTAQRIWERRIDATGDLTPVHDKHNLATPSPVTDGTLVFAWFGTGPDRRARSRRRRGVAAASRAPRTARSTFSGGTAARRCCTAIC